MQPSTPTLSSRRYPPKPVEIVYAGKRWVVTLDSVAHLLRIGLTDQSYEMLALVADAWGLSIPQVMQWAVESEVAE